MSYLPRDITFLTIHHFRRYMSAHFLSDNRMKKAKKSTTYSMSRLKKIYNQLPETFTSTDVEKAMEKFYGLTGPGKPIVSKYTKVILDLGFSEVIGKESYYKIYRKTKSKI